MCICIYLYIYILIVINSYISFSLSLSFFTSHTLSPWTSCNLHSISKISYSFFFPLWRVPHIRYCQVGLFLSLRFSIFIALFLSCIIIVLGLIYNRRGYRTVNSSLFLSRLLQSRRSLISQVPFITRGRTAKRGTVAKLAATSHAN